jgi:aconitate hydratase
MRKSTYIQEPPFFTDLSPEPKPIKPIDGARVLVMVGDSVTTDHISPAGSDQEGRPRREIPDEHGVTRSISTATAPAAATTA